MSFRLVPVFLAAAVAFHANAATILGGWYGTDEGQAQSTIAAIFLANGNYVEVEDGSHALDPTGQNGMERGTYTWNPVTGAVSINTTLDTDGQWGFSNAGVTSVSVTDTTLSAYTSDGTAVLDRVTESGNPIVGSWFFTDNPAPGDLTVLTFLPNGEYLLAIDPPAGGYMEFGNYSWDPITDSLTSSIIDSTAPQGSLNLGAFTSANFQNDELQLSSANGSVSFDSATTPEPASYSVMIAGLIFGSFLCLSRRTGRSRLRFFRTAVSD